jgi:hypothetical protein
MMLYVFIKMDGEPLRIGAECPIAEGSELETKLKAYSERGCVPCAAEEWDAVMLKEPVAPTASVDATAAAPVAATDSSADLTPPPVAAE